VSLFIVAHEAHMEQQVSHISKDLKHLMIAAVALIVGQLGVAFCIWLVCALKIEHHESNAMNYVHASLRSPCTKRVNKPTCLLHAKRSSK